MPNKNRAFNVMLDDEDKARLDELAGQLGYSKGQILRDALKNMWLHRCRNVPTCANGFGCYVPHMHTDKKGPGHVNTVPPALPQPVPEA